MGSPQAGLPLESVGPQANMSPGRALQHILLAHLMGSHLETRQASLRTGLAHGALGNSTGHLSSLHSRQGSQYPKTHWRGTPGPKAHLGRDYSCQA